MLVIAGLPRSACRPKAPKAGTPASLRLVIFETFVIFVV
jgi:hypothetical protein